MIETASYVGSIFIYESYADNIRSANIEFNEFLIVLIPINLELFS